MNPNQKKTIPEGWNETRLADVGTFSKGAGILKDQVSASGHNAVRYGEIYTKHHFYIRKIYSFVSDDVAKQATRIRYGDIVFAGSGETIEEIGKSAAYLLKEDAYAGGDTIIFRPKQADSLFLAYFLNAGEGRKKLRELGQGQSVVHIYKSDIENLKLHLPPLPEQNRIVAVLETWDQAIEKLSQKIEKKKSVKKGLMQELLIGKTRLPGFTEKWRSYSFGDLASPRKERIDPRQLSEEGFCIELEHIGSWSGGLIGSGDARTSLSLKTTFYPEDILFGKLRAYLRKYWLATTKGVCSTEIWALEVDKTKASPAILYNIIQSAKFISMAAISRGTHMPRSDWEVVRDYEVFLPSLEEQSAIADILTTADREIQTLEKKLGAIKEQKRYLLNTLITGEIRTPETLVTYS